MLHTNNPIIKHKAGLLNLAEELGNVSKACKVMGFSRDTFYRYQELVQEGGVDALISCSKRTPNLKNRIDPAIERAVLDYAVEQSAHGQHRTSNELRKTGIFVSGSGVRSIWLRHGVESFKFYTSKTPITSADLLNDKVLPFFTQQQLPMLRILTDRGTEYCGRMDQHDYQLYLATNDIDHTKTKAQSPQTNGICERFHKTILQEFYQVTFRKKLYATLEELQKDLDEWMKYYNNERTHQGKVCCGRTPLETLLDGKKVWAEKNLAQI